MKLRTRIFSFLDRASDIFAIVAGAIVMFLTLLICADVTLRYLFNRPIPHVTESTEHGLLFITFLGGAWVLKKGAHVTVDSVYNQLNPREQALFSFITSTLGAIVCFMLTWFSAQATLIAFERGTIFATIWGLPRGPILAIIPIGSFLLFIQFIKQAFLNLDNWKRKRAEKSRLQKKPFESH